MCCSSVVLFKALKIKNILHMQSMYFGNLLFNIAHNSIKIKEKIFFTGMWVLLLKEILSFSPFSESDVKISGYKSQFALN